jgi:hypothetical protein
MATILLIKKALFALLFYGSVSVIAQITNNVFGFMPQIVAGLLMLSTITPELALVSRSYRASVWYAITKGDDKFDWEDFIDAMLVWAAILPIRVVVFAYILKLMGATDISMFDILSILAGTPFVASIKGIFAFVKTIKK